MWLTERNAPLPARAIQRKPACRHPKGCARGGRPEGPSMGDLKELRPSGRQLNDTYRRSCPKGTWLKFSPVRGERGRQGN